jgi:hypothetical protein
LARWQDARSDGNAANLRCKLFANGSNRIGFHGYTIFNPVNIGSNWTETTSEIKIDDPDDPSVTSRGYHFEIHFKGQTTFYIDDVQIQEVSD